MKILALLLLLFLGPTSAQAALCTIPDIDWGYSKQFYGTDYSFIYNNDDQRLYFSYPSTQYTIYTGISSIFAHSFTYISATPQDFLNQVSGQPGAHAYLEAENCLPLLNENGEVLLTW